MTKPAEHASLEILFDQTGEISNSVMSKKREGVIDAKIYMLI